MTHSHCVRHSPQRSWVRIPPGPFPLWLWTAGGDDVVLRLLVTMSQDVGDSTMIRSSGSEATNLHPRASTCQSGFLSRSMSRIWKFISVSGTLPAPPMTLAHNVWLKAAPRLANLTRSSAASGGQPEAGPNMRTIFPAPAPYATRFCFQFVGLTVYYLTLSMPVLREK